jgi:TPR repeat protein
VELLGLACERGISESCSRLANIYLQGRHVTRDPVKARDLLDTSCARGWAPACHNLAVMFRKGDDGVPADAAKFEKYSKITQQLAEQAGGLGGHKG